MLNLKSKVSRVVPIWLIIILAFSGTAIAAFAWISNPLQNTINVTVMPITLSGTWTTNPYVGTEYQEQVSYTVNSASSGAPQGFVSMIFIGAHQLSDISLTGQTGGSGLAYTTNTPGAGYLYLVAGYPKLVNGVEVDYLFGYSATNSAPTSTPFNFALNGATSGTLNWGITYNTAATITLKIQVTATSA